MLATLSIKSRAVFISASLAAHLPRRKRAVGGFIGPAIPNDFYVFKLAYPPINASIFCFSGAGAVCAAVRVMQVVTRIDTHINIAG